MRLEIKFKSLVAMCLSIGFIQKFINSNIGKRIFFGAFWSGIGTVISRGLSVIASFCVARFCGKTAFGEYGMVVNTAAMLSTVCGMGMGHTVIKFVAELRVRNPERASRTLALTTIVTWGAGLLIGGVFICSAEYIAKVMLAAPHLANMLRIASVGVIFGIFNEVQMASLTGCEAYRERAKVMVVSGIFQSVLLIISSWAFGLIGAVVGYSLSYLLLIIITTLIIRPVWKKYRLYRNFKYMFSETKILFSFGLPTILLLFLGMPVNWFTRTLLAKIPDGYDHLAIVNAATPWCGLIMFLVTTACTALIPVISDLSGRGESARAQGIVWKALKYNAYVVIPACVIITALSPFILSFYGQSFMSGVLTFSVMMWATGIGTVYQPIWNYLVGTGKMWTNFTIVFMTAIIQIWLAWWMVPLGGVGLALASLSVSILRMILLIFLLRQLNRCMCYRKEFIAE